MLPRQPAWIVLSVGSSRSDQSGVEQLRAPFEEGRERALLRTDLLAREEEEAEVEGEAGGLGGPARELDHHREPALHVARAEPDDGAALAAAGHVVLRGHRVEVPRKDDELPFLGARRREQDRVPVVEGALQGDRVGDVAGDRSLLPAHRGDVDEVERSLRECLCIHLLRNNPTVTQRRPDPTPGSEPERGFVLAVLAQGMDEEDELAELRELIRTAGVEPGGQLVQHRAQPDRRTYVGKGKLEELKEAYERSGSEVLIVDDELDPTQQRTLENALEARVVDRTQLILDIFAQHARSAEGKLQVELAQLEYNLPRMRGMWQHLERLGGGVGTRGPGETQLETDRRVARRRVSLLKRRLAEVRSQRGERRRERQRTQVPTVALAGYTNVGKSTLLNALTGADASVDDRLFETLDPTTRGFEHDGRRYLVTDTVGFVRRLPHQLVEGFAATLEETLVADLVLHVVDASMSDERLEEQVAAVDTVLHEIAADELPVEIVVNKVDGVDALRRRRLANRFPGAVQVSALTGEGLDALRARLAERFADRFEEVRLFLPHTEGGRLAELYALGAPIDERVDTEDGVYIKARLPRRELRRFAPYLVAEAYAKRTRR